jgi:hypothetical protein
MNKLLSAFSDDTGATSMMRVIVFLVVLAVLGSAFYNAWLTKTPITWSSTDFGLIGAAVTGKLIQNTQEAAPPATPPKT